MTSEVAKKLQGSNPYQKQPNYSNYSDEKGQVLKSFLPKPLPGKRMQLLRPLENFGGRWRPQKHIIFDLQNLQIEKFNENSLM